MGIEAQSILDMELPTDPLSFRASGAYSGKVELVLTPEGLQLTGSRAPMLISLTSVTGWDFLPSSFICSFVDAEGADTQLSLRGFDLAVLRERFQLLRLKRHLGLMTVLERAQLSFQSCPHCGLLLDEPAEDSVFFCPECLSMGTDQDVLSQLDGQPYNFCNRGFFALVGTQSRRDHRSFHGSAAYSFRSLDDEVEPTLQKIAGHSLWMMLWLMGLLLSWGLLSTVDFKDSVWLVRSIYGFMGLVGLHVVYAGYYLSTLFMTRSMSSYLKRSNYQQISRLCQHGAASEAEALYQDCEIEGHPGLLANLALAWHLVGDRDKAWARLHQAVELCPTHPLLLRLAAELAPDGEKEAWRFKMKARHDFWRQRLLGTQTTDKDELTSDQSLPLSQMQHVQERVALS